MSESCVARFVPGGGTGTAPHPVRPDERHTPEDPAADPGTDADTETDTGYNRPMGTQRIFTGGCLCGAVHFEVDAPTKWAAHCHCSLCRRAHGAAFVTWFGVDRGAFRFTAGEDEVAWYASTPEARRGFCRSCGSTMFFRGERWPDEIHIALAEMDGPIDRDPTAHVFYDSHVPWVVLGDGLKRRGGPSGTDPLT